MSYVVEQKVGETVYVYEVSSYWDKEKKQPRQKRTFLGKKDPETGQLIPKRQKHYRSFEYGPIYFLTSLVESLGIKDRLEEAFPDVAREILLTACFQVAEHQALYRCNRWLERIYLSSPCELPSQRLSRLGREIGENEEAVSSFFSRWAERERAARLLVFDITSISSYARFIDFVEWGYNRDKERLPQINLGVVYAEPSATPLLYSLYPGSVPDVKTLKNIVKKLSVFKVAKTLFVLDKGFYSAANLREMGSDLQFLIPVPTGTKIAGECIERHAATMVNTDNAFTHGKQLLYRIEDFATIGDRTYRLWLILDTKRKQQQESDLHAAIIEVEHRVRERRESSHTALHAFLDETYPEWHRYFTIEYQSGSYGVQTNRSAIAQTVQRFGTLVLLTNSTTLAAEEALSMYRKKDGVEKFFDAMKNGLDRKRLRIHSRRALEGMLFIDFVSLILYSHIERQLKSTPLGKHFTVHELFDELKKLSVVRLGDNQMILSEVTKHQNDIFKTFEIPEPSLA
jgi:transposase